MATRFVGTPESAHFPASNFPQITQVNQRPALGYDAATSEAAYWTDIAPQGLTGTLTLIITYVMASATSGAVIFRAAIEAVSDGDGTPNLASATSFDTANSSATTTVPATAGLIDQISITLTNADSIAAGDYYRISVDRDAANVSDTATGDAQVLAIELRDAA